CAPAMALSTVLLLLFMVSVRTNAQVTKGSISGTVVDAQGGSVPDAAIKIKNKETGEENSTTTDSAGLFKLNLVSIGQYTLEVSKQGFRKFVVSAVTVSSGQDSGLGELKLEVGDVATTVEVSGAAVQLIQQSEAQISNSFSASQVATLPGVLENQGLDSLA